MIYKRRNLPHIIHNVENYFVTYRQKGTWKSEESTQESFGVLCQHEIGSIVLADWKNRNGQINLCAVCVMGTHVHVVLSTLESGPNLLKVMADHKARTGREINRVLGKSGPFWQPEYFDRTIRDGKFLAALDYTIQNPVKAGLTEHWANWPLTYVSPEFKHLID